MTSEPETPNPGSDEAHVLGCICATLDNCHGKFPPFAPGTELGGKTGGWYITVGCPVHAPKGEDDQ